MFDKQQYILEAKLTKPNSFFGVTIQKGNLHIIFNYYPALLY